jgi:hypothetical protein
MTNSRILAVAFLVAILFVPSGYAQELSKYREFSFGMKLEALTKQIQVKPSEARVIHLRPALIQELEWNTDSQQRDSVKAILFSFYNGELYRMVITYDRDRTAGLTTEDIIGAVSAQYGAASRPAGNLIFSSMYVYDGEKIYSEDSQKILARWEDAQFSLNLFQLSFEQTYGLVMYSKRLASLAQAASATAIRLDKQEFPQREMARKKKEAEDNRARQEKSRRENKSPFRP